MQARMDGERLADMSRDNTALESANRALQAANKDLQRTLDARLLQPSRPPDVTRDWLRPEGGSRGPPDRDLGGAAKPPLEPVQWGHRCARLGGLSLLPYHR